ncbi:MAG: hypothetical protein N4A59_08325 [Marinifilum sp.]|jgi:hypothetical protein|nr:hypothetical protein [Marinifilum sp.]
MKRFIFTLTLLSAILCTNAFSQRTNKVEILYEIATTYEEFGNNKKKALKYYSQYINQTDDIGGERYEYAKSRILHIKEKIHLEK